MFVKDPNAISYGFQFLIIILTIITLFTSCKKFSILNYIAYSYCILIIVIIIVMPNLHHEYVFLFIVSGFIMYIYSIILMVTNPCTAHTD